MARGRPWCVCACWKRRAVGTLAGSTGKRRLASAMRVLQLGPYPPPHGGVQTNLVAIRDYLRRRQIPCAVINLTRYRRTAQDDVYYPKNALEVLGLLVRLRYDIIHLHFGGDLNPSLLGLALVCTMLPGKRVVLT